MDIINKIRDFLGIEHHPLGTIRIVEMENGEFEVQVWDEYLDYPVDTEWRVAELYNKDGKKCRCRTDSLENARKLKTAYEQYVKDHNDRITIKRVVEITEEQ